MSNKIWRKYWTLKFYILSFVVNIGIMTVVSNQTMAKQAMQWFVDKAKADGKTYKALLLIGAV